MALHRYDHIEQRSEEWHALRRGIITASTIAPLITTRRLTAIDHDCPECGARATEQCLNRKRDGTIKSLHPARTAAAKAGTSPLIIEPASNDKAQSLTLHLAAERCTGYTEPTFVSDDMWRGVEDEPIARDLYSEHYAPVTECGFMIRDDHSRIGYSPDGLVGDDGLIEIKSRRQKTQLATILAGHPPIEVMPQLQCGLYVSGRKWIDYVSFCGGMPLIVKRVYRDSRWIDAIIAAAIRYEAAATEIHRQYAADTEGLVMTERRPILDEVELKL